MVPDRPENILATPFRLGSLTLANRMVMGPMAANSPREDGPPASRPPRSSKHARAVAWE